VDVVDDDHPEDAPGFDILTQWRLVEDAEVIDSAGGSLGTAIAFLPEDPEDGRPDYLLVEEGFFRRHRFYIPVEHIVDYRDGKLYLSATEDEAKQRGWTSPPDGIDLSVE
jgi:hypothetical protein